MQYGPSSTAVGSTIVNALLIYYQSLRVLTFQNINHIVLTSIAKFRITLILNKNTGGFKNGKNI